MLMERFYDVDRGCVKLDGVDVRELNPAWLRLQIGIVSQEPVLLDATVLENIRYGKLDATDGECVEAAKLSNAYDFVNGMRMEVRW
jgi:ABC-type multidrug transport system fused ATPase/permease subunit